MTTNKPVWPGVQRATPSLSTFKTCTRNRMRHGARRDVCGCVSWTLTCGVFLQIPKYNCLKTAYRFRSFMCDLTDVVEMMCIFVCVKNLVPTLVFTRNSTCICAYHAIQHTRYTLGERQRGAARRGKRRRRTRGYLRESEGAERLEAHTSMSRGWDSARVEGGGANARFRWSDGVSVRVRGAPQTSRLVRRSWSPRV